MVLCRVQALVLRINEANPALTLERAYLIAALPRAVPEKIEISREFWCIWLVWRAGLR